MWYYFNKETYKYWSKNGLIRNLKAMNKKLKILNPDRIKAKLSILSYPINEQNKTELPIVVWLYVLLKEIYVLKI